MLALSGCALGPSGGQPPASNSNPLAAARAAAAKLESTSAATVHISGTTSAAGLGAVKFAGVEQLQPTVAVDLKIDLSGVQLGAVGAGTMEVIVKDEVEYINLGALGLGGLVKSGKPWLKMDLNAMPNMPGAAGGLLSLGTVSENTDPGQQMKLLLTSANLKKVGTETVDGVKATHYLGTVDTAGMAQRAGTGLTPDQLQRLKNVFQQAGFTTEKIEVWLDTSDLPVEFKVVASTTSQGALSTDIHYSDWGSPVTVNAPPPDQVTFSGLSGLPGMPHS